MGDSPNSPTQRAADFMKILEAQKFGVPIPPELFVQYLDVPNKQQIMQRMIQMQEQAAAAQNQNAQQNQSAPVQDLTAGQPMA